MKKVWMAVAASLVILSCANEEPAPLKPIADTLVPDSMVEIDFTKKFHYNTDGRLAQVKMTTALAGGGTLESEQNFIYDANGRLVESTTDTGWRIVYFFTNDQISRSDEYVNGALSQYHTYKYNSKGRLVESITWQNIPEEGGEIPVAKDEYTYDENENVVEQRLYYYTSFGAEAKLSTTFINSDFDDKINSEDYFDVHPFNPLIKMSKNNPGKMEIKNQNGFTFSRETYTYDYHPDGYPTKKSTFTELYNGNSGSYVTTYTFKSK